MVEKRLIPASNLQGFSDMSTISRAMSGRGLRGIPPRTSSRSRRFALEVLETRQLLATFRVNTFSDPILPLPGRLSLRQAIVLAALHPGKDKIVLPARINGQTGTYSLNPLLGSLVILNPLSRLTIESQTSAQAKINAQGSSRVFTILPTSNVKFENLSISGGSSSDSGGGVWNAGALTLEDVGVTGNRTTGGFAPGGGIANYGFLALKPENSGSAISSNATQGVNSPGGGVANYGFLAFAPGRRGYSVTGNATQGVNSAGGGIANFGFLAFASGKGASSISNNATSGANSPGGGIANQGAFAMAGLHGATALAITGNSTSGAGSSGGGIWNTGALALATATISGNRTGNSMSDGGGIASDALFALTNSVVSGNQTTGLGGGIYLGQDSFHNVIGGITQHTGNVITSNSGVGVYLAAANTTLFKNTIADNTGAGVAVVGLEAFGNPIQRNSIYGNGGLGIDLGNDGVTPNDYQDPDINNNTQGPNLIQNYPVLTSFTPGKDTRVVGTLNTTPYTTATIDVYIAAPDPSGLGQGKTWLGSFVVSTNDKGNASFDVTLKASTRTGSVLTATATVNGNTSEFSENVAYKDPVVVDSTYTIDADTTLSVPAPGVLSGAVNPTPDPLIAHVLVGPEHGTLVLQPSGAFTYTPQAGFSGTDTFTFNATAGTAVSNTGTVTLNVLPAGSPIVVDQTAETKVNTTLVQPAPGVLNGSVSPGGKPLAAVLISPAGHGSVTLNPDGSATYTPNPDYVGGDSFQFAATNGTQSSNIATTFIDVTPRSPRVVSFARVGVHSEPTTLVLAFSQPMDQASVTNLGNYAIAGAGGHVRVSAASYDPGTNSVTLTTSQRLNFYRSYQLTVVAVPPNGVKDAAGLPLEGAGAPGTNYVVNFKGYQTL